MTKTILITGGSKGLGLCITQRQLEHRNCVIVLSRSHGGLAPLLEQYPEQLHWIQTDLASPANIDESFTHVRHITEKLDALILNAAQSTPMVFSKMSAEDLRKSFDINAISTLLCLKHSLTLLTGGRAVFVSSESVPSPYPLLSIYAATKAAIENAFIGLRPELYRDFKIQLTSLRAGHMGNTSFNETWPDEDAQMFYQLATESGSMAAGGSPMQTARVAEVIEKIIDLPKDVTINALDVRSGDSF